MPHWIHASDRRHFETEGYMVIRNVIPESLIAAAVRDIAAFVGADLSDSRTWYNGPPVLDGVVPMHHAQSLWDIRQHPNLHEVFTEYFGFHQLMLDINRCIFRPPVHPSHPERSQSDIHWDTDPRVEIDGNVQAGVQLTPISPATGGFQCIPGIYRNLNAWLARHAHNNSSFRMVDPGLKDTETVQVTANVGDLIIWSTKLPHGSAANHSKQPRIAMFVTLTPPEDSQEFRDGMKDLWLTRRAPEYWRGMPGQLDPEPGAAPAQLTELGRKLLGLDPW
jgi:hypothetical protein